MKWRKYPSLPKPGDRILAKLHGYKRAAYFVLDIQEAQSLCHIEKWVPFDEVLDLTSWNELEIDREKTMDTDYREILEILDNQTDNKTLDEHDRLYANVRELLHDNPLNWSTPYFIHTILSYLIMMIYESSHDQDQAATLIKMSHELGRKASKYFPEDEDK